MIRVVQYTRGNTTAYRTVHLDLHARTHTRTHTTLENAHAEARTCTNHPRHRSSSHPILAQDMCPQTSHLGQLYTATYWYDAGHSRFMVSRQMIVCRYLGVGVCLHQQR